MSINYGSKVDTIVDILKASNTTTAAYNLSASLTTKIPDASILNDDPAIQGFRTDKYPAIMVSINNASEEETQMGSNYVNRKKEKTISYDIHGFYKKEGHSRTHATSLNDFYQMAENVEAVLKRNADLSGTALHMSLVDTDFKVEQPEQGWIKVFKIGVEVRYFYS